MAESVTVFAPATVANLACGFDVLGLAVEQPGDYVKVWKNGSRRILIEKIIGDDGQLPLHVEKNTAGVAVAGLLKYLGIDDLGISIEVHKEMPLGSGLGSSAASSVAAVVGANELLGKPFQHKLDLLPFAIEAERVACGAAHADNVAPSLLGGIVLIKSYNPLLVVNLPVPDDLQVVVVHPHVEVKTSDARQILKKEIPVHKAVDQWGNVAGLVAGLYRSDYQLIGASLQDVVFEPVRKLLIPGFDEVKAAALAQGALGCSISGSGPSVFALFRDQQSGQAIADAMQAAFKKFGVGSEAYLSKVNKVGPRII
jgi:homoserine kinase